MEEQQAKGIKAKIRAKMDDFLLSIKNEKIRELFKEHSYVAGGAIASLLQGEEPSDYDIYFKNSTACAAAAEEFIFYESICESIIELPNQVALIVPGGMVNQSEIEGVKYHPIVLTENAITLTDGIQIILRFVGIGESLIQNFDFLHCQTLYDYKTNEILMSEEVEKAVQNKRLIFTGSHYPLASLVRTRKFVKREYKINAGQYVKIALELNRFDLKDPRVLREQLVGVDLMLFADLLSLMEKEQLDETDKKRMENLFSLIDKGFEREDDNYPDL